MKTALRFPSNGEPSVEIVAETDAERAILAFLAEGLDRRWQCAPHYHYRPGGVERIALEAIPVEQEKAKAS